MTDLYLGNLRILERRSAAAGVNYGVVVVAAAHNGVVVEHPLEPDDAEALAASLNAAAARARSRS